MTVKDFNECYKAVWNDTAPAIAALLRPRHRRKPEPPAGLDFIAWLPWIPILLLFTVVQS